MILLRSVLRGLEFAFGGLSLGLETMGRVASAFLRFDEGLVAGVDVIRLAI